MLSRANFVMLYKSTTLEREGECVGAEVEFCLRQPMTKFPGVTICDY